MANAELLQDRGIRLMETDTGGGFRVTLACGHKFWTGARVAPQAKLSCAQCYAEYREQRKRETEALS